MANLQHASLKGTVVRFYVRDIHIPQPTAVLTELHRTEQLRGRVLDVSDSGTPAGVFLVIEVDGFKQLCILPAERVLPMV
jgi:hypothetical protein